MNGQKEEAVVYSPANDNVARVIAYYGPYLFWSAIGAITFGIVLLG